MGACRSPTLNFWRKARLPLVECSPLVCLFAFGTIGLGLCDTLSRDADAVGFVELPFHGAFLCAQSDPPRHVRKTVFLT